MAQCAGGDHWFGLVYQEWAGTLLLIDTEVGRGIAMVGSGLDQVVQKGPGASGGSPGQHTLSPWDICGPGTQVVDHLVQGHPEVPSFT